LEAVVTHRSVDLPVNICACSCAAAVVSAICHHNNQNSGYSIGWFTLTGRPGEFTSYTVNSVT
jgi:hypothetical protein